MRQKAPILFALSMLVCLFFTVMLWHEINTLTFESEDTRAHAEILEGKIRRQQQEYDMLVEVLPGMREEDARLGPAAEEAMALEKDLKAQRRALRKDIEKIEKEAVLWQYTAALYENTALQAALAEFN